MITATGGMTEKPNMEASIAASKALQSGKTIEEATAIAMEAANADPKPAAATDDGEVRRHYLIAVCNLGHGNFNDKSLSELVEVAALVEHRYNSFDIWNKNLSE